MQSTLHPRSLRSLTALIACSILAGAATAAADVVVIPVAEDTAPYSFVPGLGRGSSPTLYAFESVDEEGTPHDFSTFLWFDVAPTDLPEGHVVTQAQLLVTYAFDFAGFGDPSTAQAELHCREVLETWNDATLTWTHQPAYDDAFDVVTGIDAFGALLCDATPVVQDWLAGLTPNHGFALTNPSDRVIGMHAMEAVADASLKPQLILTTEVPEPGFIVSLTFGLVGLATVGRSRRKHRDEEAADDTRRPSIL